MAQYWRLRLIRQVSRVKDVYCLWILLTRLAIPAKLRLAQLQLLSYLVLEVRGMGVKEGEMGRCGRRSE